MCIHRHSDCVPQATMGCCWNSQSYSERNDVMFHCCCVFLLSPRESVFEQSASSRSSLCCVCVCVCIHCRCCVLHVVSCCLVELANRGGELLYTKGIWLSAYSLLAEYAWLFFSIETAWKLWQFKYVCREATAICYVLFPQSLAL